MVAIRTDEAPSAAEPAGLRQAELRSGDARNSRLILNAGLAEHIGSAIRLRAQGLLEELAWMYWTS